MSISWSYRDKCVAGYIVRSDCDCGVLVLQSSFPPRQLLVRVCALGWWWTRIGGCKKGWLVIVSTCTADMVCERCLLLSWEHCEKRYSWSCRTFSVVEGSKFHEMMLRCLIGWEYAHFLLGLGGDAIWVSCWVMMRIKLNLVSTIFWGWHWGVCALLGRVLLVEVGNAFLKNSSPFVGIAETHMGLWALISPKSRNGLGNEFIRSVSCSLYGFSDSGKCN